MEKTIIRLHREKEQQEMQQCLGNNTNNYSWRIGCIY